MWVWLRVWSFHVGVIKHLVSRTVLHFPIFYIFGVHTIKVIHNSECLVYHRYNSFYRSKLHLDQVLIFMHCWSEDLPLRVCGHEAAIRTDGNTKVDWANFCRTVRKVLFFHRKYNRGQVRPNHWVLGGIERELHKCFLFVVANCRVATLEALILRYIRPGSHIVSDM